MNNGQAGTSDETWMTKGQLVPAPRAVPAMPDPYGPLAGHLRADEPDEPGLNPGEILRILNKRKWLIRLVHGGKHRRIDLALPHGQATDSAHGERV